VNLVWCMNLVAFIHCRTLFNDFEDCYSTVRLLFHIEISKSCVSLPYG
jgi:hypothetical protein